MTTNLRAVSASATATSTRRDAKGGVVASGGILHVSFQLPGYHTNLSGVSSNTFQPSLAFEDVDNVQPRGRRGDHDSVPVNEHLPVESATPPQGDINNSAEVSARDGWAADSYQCGQDLNSEYLRNEGNDDD